MSVLMIKTYYMYYSIVLYYEQMKNLHVYG